MQALRFKDKLSCICSTLAQGDVHVVFLGHFRSSELNTDVQIFLGLDIRLFLPSRRDVVSFLFLPFHVYVHLIYLPPFAPSHLLTPPYVSIPVPLSHSPFLVEDVAAIMFPYPHHFSFIMNVIISGSNGIALITGTAVEICNIIV